MGSDRVIHLELHTDNLPRACDFYAQLCGWSFESVRAAGGSYVAVELASQGIGGGVVERELDRPLWLPYVQVCDLGEATARARMLGATVTLGPREGPAGWRSLLSVPSGAEIALWQPKQ